MTTTTDTTIRRCTMCGQGPSVSRKLLVAGAAPICRECDEKFRTVFRNQLEPQPEGERPANPPRNRRRPVAPRPQPPNWPQFSELRILQSTSAAVRGSFTTSDHRARASVSSRRGPGLSGDVATSVATATRGSQGPQG